MNFCNLKIAFFSPHKGVWQSSAKTLVVSYVGMMTQEVTIHPNIKFHISSIEEVMIATKPSLGSGSNITILSAARHLSIN